MMYVRINEKVVPMIRKSLKELIPTKIVIRAVTKELES